MNEPRRPTKFWNPGTAAATAAAVSIPMMPGPYAVAGYKRGRMRGQSKPRAVLAGAGEEGRARGLGLAGATLASATAIPRVSREFQGLWKQRGFWKKTTLPKRVHIGAALGKHSFHVDLRHGLGPKQFLTGVRALPSVRQTMGRWMVGGLAGYAVAGIPAYLRYQKQVKASAKATGTPLHQPTLLESGAVGGGIGGGIGAWALGARGAAHQGLKTALHRGLRGGALGLAAGGVTAGLLNLRRREGGFKGSIERFKQDARRRLGRWGRDLQQLSGSK